MAWIYKQWRSDAMKCPEVSIFEDDGSCNSAKLLIEMNAGELSEFVNHAWLNNPCSDHNNLPVAKAIASRLLMEKQ